MSEAFVPLVPSAARPHEAAFTALSVNHLATGGAHPISATATPGGADACSKPVVTLQRKGDVVSGIRIQCGCGQVIELTLAY